MREAHRHAFEFDRRVIVEAVAFGKPRPIEVCFSAHVTMAKYINHSSLHRKGRWQRRLARHADP